MTLADVLAQAQQALQAGDLARARACIDAALAATPDHPGAQAMLAAERRAAGDLGGALAALTRALAAAPNPAGYFNRAGVLIDLARLSEARADLEAALALRPGHAPTWLRLARTHEKLGDTAQALTAYDETARRAGDSADLLYDRARCLAALGRQEEAAAAYMQSFTLKPDETARVNAAGSLYEIDRLDEAAAALRASVATAPSAEGYGNLGRTLLALGELGDARAALSAAIEMIADAPRAASLRYLRALAALSMHDLSAGFADFEARWGTGLIDAPPLDRGEPAWRGEKLTAPLRIWRDQGIGDEVIFARFLPAARERAGDLIVECSVRLMPLFARSFPDLRFAAAAEPAPAQTSLGGLGAALTIAHTSGAPYLRADAVRNAALREAYRSRAGTRKVIGIAWRSAGRHHEQKSSTLRDWRELLAQDCLFVDLQYGDTASEIADVHQAFGCELFTDASVDQLADLDGFAAQVAAMDAIVTVSNSTAHFAGALGVPCAVLAAPTRGRLWYWGAQGERTPWYDSVRIVRRDPHETWEDQIARAASLMLS